MLPHTVGEMHSLPAFVIKQTVWMSLLSGHSVGKFRQSNAQGKERHQWGGGLLTSSLCVILLVLLSPLKPLSDMNMFFTLPVDGKGFLHYNSPLHNEYRNVKGSSRRVAVHRKVKIPRIRSSLTGRQGFVSDS